ncbi:NADPH:adrenodoxin oxidoreductase, mitochondrial [Porphyridium purpureum]|uniref:NADPH:adrenodoxin oxidoreductase, mitochondrial n=1 Tax=Porphyridium purpureum TaxID=35688 RepID=A0A5J4Z163_PORPP|nr:NADPH:adrenodoxin oxidoreductase, mitochondrial [Porphyridium purpureum]|eukprot:POR9726..scf208_2
MQRSMFGLPHARGCFALGGRRTGSEFAGAATAAAAALSRMPASWKSASLRWRAAVCAGAFPNWVSRPLSSEKASARDGHKFKVAVIGSGPAGCYAVAALTKQIPKTQLEVDVLDELPTPFGLVRYGIAPDHQEAKAVVNQFAQSLSQENVRFRGNVKVGVHVSVAELRSMYHAVIAAAGAQSERKIDVPGESLHGVLSARKFVAWYNGHPHFTKLHVPLDHRTTDVVVVGNGNVAIDVARILLKTPEELARSDIAQHAWEKLSQCSVKRVHLVGRRGLAQASWSAKELREIVQKLPNVRVKVNPDEIKLSDVDLEELEMEENRAKKRCTGIVQQAAAEQESAAAEEKRLFEGEQQTVKELHLRFLRTPVLFLPKDDDANSVGWTQFARNHLAGPPGKQRAHITTNMPAGCETIPSTLVLVSVGYKVGTFDGLPVDTASGVIHNVKGRVKNQTGEFLPGLYVTGWMKRGSSGIVGSNRWDAEETIRCVIEDLASAPLDYKAGGAALDSLLDIRGVRLVDFDSWRRIDTRESAAGAAMGKPRQKLTSLEELLHTASTDQHA